MAEDDPKEVEYYSAMAHAWMQTRFERDKGLMVLSASAIGILVSLMTTKGAGSILQLVFYILATMCFLVCLFCVLTIFKLNSSYLEKLVHSKDRVEDRLLSFLDIAASSSFMFGVVFSVVIGISIATSVFIKKEVAMSDNKNDVSKSVSSTMVFSDDQPDFLPSVYEFDQMAPNSTKKKKKDSKDGSRKESRSRDKDDNQRGGK